MSDDGSVIIAGNSQRLYLSTNSGANWSEVRPAGDADKNWRTSAMSDDGSVIIAGNSLRLYLFCSKYLCSNCGVYYRLYNRYGNHAYGKYNYQRFNYFEYQLSRRLS